MAVETIHDVLQMFLAIYSSTSKSLFMRALAQVRLYLTHDITWNTGSEEEQEAKPSQEERREELNLQTSEGGGLSLIEVPVTTFHKSSPAAHLGKGKGGNNARKGNGARGAYHPRKWKEGYSGRPNPAMRKEPGNFLSH
ncbi:hypothetical protein TNCV_2094241 [Trichonephila clavipes]|nr:hypothetical protein TNCV_2094241 [Trichonephila clavipes]